MWYNYHYSIWEVNNFFAISSRGQPHPKYKTNSARASNVFGHSENNISVIVWGRIRRLTEDELHIAERCPVDREGTRSTKSKHSTSSIRGVRVRFVWLYNSTSLRCNTLYRKADDIMAAKWLGPVDREDSRATKYPSNMWSFRGLRGCPGRFVWLCNPSSSRDLFRLFKLLWLLYLSLYLGCIKMVAIQLEEWFEHIWRGTLVVGKAIINLCACLLELILLWKSQHQGLTLAVCTWKHLEVASYPAFPTPRFLSLAVWKIVGESLDGFLTWSVPQMLQRCLCIEPICHWEVYIRWRHCFVTYPLYGLGWEKERFYGRTKGENYTSDACFLLVLLLPGHLRCNQRCVCGWKCPSTSYYRFSYARRFLHVDWVLWSVLRHIWIWNIQIAAANKRVDSWLILRRLCNWLHHLQWSSWNVWSLQTCSLRY